MRTFKLQVQVSIDGYMSGPNGEMDWLTPPITDDIAAYMGALTGGMDTIVLGRHLAEGFIPHWAAGPDDEPQQAIDQINDAHKIVVSDTLTESPWPNTEIVSGSALAERINKLKTEPGGDILVYGGGTLVSSLIALELIDELHLFVNPTAIGAGMPVFGGNQEFRLLGAHPFTCGITALHYEPKRTP